MTRRTSAALAATVVVLGAAALIVNAGDLNPPPGAVAPTMLTLDDLNNSINAVGGGSGGCGEALPGLSHAGGSLITSGSPGPNPTSPIPIYSFESSMDASGAPSYGGFIVTRHMDQFSPSLRNTAHMGQPIQDVEMVLLDQGGAGLMEIALTDAVISNITVSMVPRCEGGFSTVEVITFAPGTVSFTHIPSGAQAGWDLMTNQPI